MKKQCKQKRAIAGASQHWDWIKLNALFIGIASLIWLFIKSGRKPYRLQYPCQKAAAVNVSFFLLPLLLALIHKTFKCLKTYSQRQVIRFLYATLLSIGIVFAGVQLWTKYQLVQQLKYYEQIRRSGPIGKKITSASGLATGFMTIPHAMAIPSPHRVVSVHHSGATSWDFQCTSSGSCPVYYGDDNYVDQNVVGQMVRRGMLELTDTDSIEDAWEVILPDYQAGEIVAIKVNFNCGTVFDDDDAYIDALPQVVNAVIAGLKVMGVAEGNIRVYDSTRAIPDRFRALIDYPGIQYYGSYSNGADVERSTFNSGLASAQIDFSDSGYSATAHKISDVLIDSDYLINIPIMKKHGGAGITLSAKNHFGSVNLSGFDHDYIYLYGDNYEHDINPIVDINKNTHIKDKTVLIIGDALYGGWSDNSTPPERWDSFSNDSPNMLFFAVDPVAVDSVMFDYLDREGYVNQASEDILVVAANAGLGVHERWNNYSDREYTTIDYVEIDLNDSQPPSIPMDLSASAVSATHIDLSWSASTDADSVVDGYNIYRDGIKVGSTTGTTYSDTGLAPATSYSYTVSANDQSGNESSQSDQVVATTETDMDPPSIPSDVTATSINATQVSLSWAGSYDNVSVTGYHVYRDGNLIGDVSSTTYTDINLTPSTEYTYTVSAYDSAGNESGYSNPFTATTVADTEPAPTPEDTDTDPPSIPSDVTATSINATQVSLSWAGSYDNVSVTGYHVYRDGNLIGDVSSTTYTDINLTPSTEYTYTVSAYDSSGNESGYSNPFTATTVADTEPAPTPEDTDTDPPSIPSDVAATSINATQVSLSWAGSYDNVSVTGYHVYRGGNLIGDVSSTIYTDTNLTPSTEYTYTVSAFDSSGNESGQSTPATLQTLDGAIRINNNNSSTEKSGGCFIEKLF